MDDFVPCLVPPSLPIEVEAEDGGGGGLSLSWVLLDKTAYISATAVSNTTTAIGVMSTDKPIHVSFRLAVPPRLSYLCVHFPGPGARLSITVPADTPAVRCAMEAPQVISTHADVALLRVAVPGARDLRNPRYHDYFVYTAGRRSLDRLPHPHRQGATFMDSEVAIFSCSGSGGTSRRYVIAGLRNTVNSREFKLQRYDSDTCSWTSTLLSVHAPERDEVLPIPSTATGFMFHGTSKVITLGGPRATICWVDLWRGMLLCDVLDGKEKPMLRDVPLPKPSRANRGSFCRGCPHTYRDITVVTLPGQPSEIKYVDMEIRAGMDMPPPSRQSDDDSDDDDAECDGDLDAAPYWNATVWTMPVPVTSYKDWRKDKDCKVDVTDIVVDNPRHSELLLPLPRLRIDPENATMSLRRLRTAHPALGLGRDGDLVFYFLSKVNLVDNKGWVIAVGARDKKLLGIAELDSRKNTGFMRYYHHTDISQYLIKATGEVGPLVESKHACSTNPLNGILHLLRHGPMMKQMQDADVRQFRR